MNPKIEIRTIPAAETLRLRHSVLRPYMPMESLVYPGDAAPESQHFGAFLDQELIGIASVSCEAFEGEVRAWRLRGMATAEHVRRLGAGRALIEACVKHVVAHQGRILWCNGRTSAWGFYRAMGFQKCGGEYNPGTGTGPHYVMVKYVPSSS
jgi:predicted GNAT family N-acyltransferase